MIQGLGMHAHHKKLFEFVWDFEERMRAIEAKPPDEVELRKRLFKMVVGPLPPAVAEALAAYVEALAAYDEALAVYEKAWAAYNQALAAREEAKAALKIVLEQNMPAMLALHAQECPGCPWDGSTIFPDK